MELDPRLLEVTIQVGNDFKTYSNLYIQASGTKYANSLQNECEVQIWNLDRNTQNQIITEANPSNLNRVPKILIIRAGRKSYGVTQIYSGNIVTAIPGSPPDISLNLKCQSGLFLNGQISSVSLPQTNFKQICQNVATGLNSALNFQANDKTISNYNFSGAIGKQVDLLGKLGDADAFVDDDVLVIKNRNQPLPGRVKLVSIGTGMLDKPELTVFGIKVKYLLDNQTQLGGVIQVRSITNPTANGDYTIYKLSFSVANRDTPFYYIAEGFRIST
jgi:hypothetical protein